MGARIAGRHAEKSEIDEMRGLGPGLPAGDQMEGGESSSSGTRLRAGHLLSSPNLPPLFIMSYVVDLILIAKKVCVECGRASESFKQFVTVMQQLTPTLSIIQENCCEYAAFQLRSAGEARYEARGEATDDLLIKFLLRLYIRGWPSVLGICISSASIIK